MAWWHSSVHIVECIILPIVLIAARVVRFVGFVLSYPMCEDWQGQRGQVALRGRNFDSQYGNKCNYFVVPRWVC